MAHSLRKAQHIRVVSNRPGWTYMLVSPALESKEEVAERVRPHLAGLPPELKDGLLLAIDELLGNAIEHGCRLNPQGIIDFLLIRGERMLLLLVRDDGEGFSVNSVTHAAVNNPPNDPLHHTELRSQMGLRPGGFGIMLAKKVADELLYNQHGNAVMLIKYLDEPESRVQESDGNRRKISRSRRKGS